MKKIIYILLISCFTFSCKKNEEALKQEKNPNNIPVEILDKIKGLGFSTYKVLKSEYGYIVEGDILLTEENLKTINKISESNTSGLRTSESEQYQTTYILTGLPKLITISISNLPPTYTDALDQAILRYNSLGLQLTFQRVNNNGAIQIQYGTFSDPGIYGSSGGFPLSNGTLNSAPIVLSSDAIGYNPPINFLATIIAHEIGHCIGFRHTDFFNRSYSACLVDAKHPNNEGQSSVGAINIPLTPAIEDPNSWMLACNGGVSREFNFYDRTALNYLYSNRPINLSYQNGGYPQIAVWQAPKNSASNPLVGYELKYNLSTYQVGEINSSIISTTNTSYTFPFTAHQYSGASLITSVRAKYSSGLVSNWVVYNTTLD